MDMEPAEESARRKIAELYGTEEGKFGPTLFVAHHRDELEPDFFLNTYGSANPSATQILSSLVLVDTWSSEDDDNIDVFDFSLPGDVTNYVLSVRFEGCDAVEVSMES